MYGIYEYEERSRPAVMLLDQVTGSYEMLYRYTEDDLRTACLSYELDFRAILDVLNTVKPGTIQVMIDVEQYKKGSPGKAKPDLSSKLVKRLGRIKTGDSETAHWAADKVLLDALPENVQRAYRRVIERNTN